MKMFHDVLLIDFMLILSRPAVFLPSCHAFCSNVTISFNRPHIVWTNCYFTRLNTHIWKGRIKLHSSLNLANFFLVIDLFHIHVAEHLFRNKRLELSRSDLIHYKNDKLLVQNGY